MQENEFLLVNDNKEGVNKFRKLGENEQLDPKSGTARPVRGSRFQTQILTKTVRVQIVQELWYSSRHAHKGKGRQHKVPSRHGVPPVPTFAVDIILLSKFDENHVQDASNNWNNGMIFHPVLQVTGIVVGFESNSILM